MSNLDKKTCFYKERLVLWLPEMAAIQSRTGHKIDRFFSDIFSSYLDAVTIACQALERTQTGKTTAKYLSLKHLTGSTEGLLNHSIAANKLRTDRRKSQIITFSVLD